MHVQLQSGLPGVIDEDRISDQWTRVPTDVTGSPQLPISEGSIISMRVLQVHQTEFRVTGGCRGQDLRTAVSRTIAEEEAQLESRRAAQARQYTKRRISHPLFKNGTLEQVSGRLLWIALVVFPVTPCNGPILLDVAYCAHHHDGR